MNWHKFPYPIVCVIAYFLIGYLTHRWDYNWLVYLTIPIYYSFAHSTKPKQDKDPDKNNDWSSF